MEILVRKLTDEKLMIQACESTIHRFIKNDIR